MAMRKRQRHLIGCSYYWATLSLVEHGVDGAVWQPLFGLPQQRRLVRPSFHVPRGGSASSSNAYSTNGGDETEDKELDAYIEELIASVEGEETDDVPSFFAPQSPKEGPKDGMERNKSPPPTKTTESTQAVVLNHDVESDVVLSSETEDIAENRTVCPEEVLETTTVPASSLEKEAVKPAESQPEDVVDGVADVTTKVGASVNVTAAGEKTPATMQRRLHPLLRSLLRQGVVGRVCAMALLLTSDFVETYVPPLASLWKSVNNYLFPYDPERELLRASQPEETDLAAVSTRTRRTGQTARQRRQLTKEADRIALRQLKQLGDVQEAKYMYVSRAFLQRHALGPFAGVVESPEEAKRVKTRRKRTKQPRVVEEEDWVVKALTVAKSTTQAGGLRNPAVGLGVGSRGVSLDLEFSLGDAETGRTDSVIQAAVESKKKPKKKHKRSAGPRSSDRDGGDGLFGRIRAAAGANSLVSRSLLGAYPGDAVSPSEAGSADGVTDLARKYGWGEWSSDEDAESFRPRKKRRKVKRFKKSNRRSSTHKRQSSSSRSSTSSLNVGVEFDFSKARRKRQKSASLSPRRSNDPPVQNPRSRLMGMADREAGLRAPLERIQEMKRKKSDD